MDGMTSLPPHTSAPRDGSDKGSRSFPEHFMFSRHELDLHKGRNQYFPLLMILPFIIHILCFVNYLPEGF
jgi:hypothetical protein